MANFVTIALFNSQPKAEGARLHLAHHGIRSVLQDENIVAQVPYPTSVLPYQEGILVAAAPDILWFRDGEGDGVAEQRTILMSGFGQGNQQLRVNGLIWGLDGWVYGANGRSDGEIAFVDPSGSASPRDSRGHLRRRNLRT